MAYSLERIELLVAAKRKQRASDLLIQVQAAQCDSESWKKLQRQLLEQLR